jgi:hypothetical protein
VASTQRRSKKFSTKNRGDYDSNATRATWGYVPDSLLRHTQNCTVYHLRRDSTGSMVPVLLRRGESTSGLVSPHGGEGNPKLLKEYEKRRRRAQNVDSSLGD